VFEYVKNSDLLIVGGYDDGVRNVSTTSPDFSVFILNPGANPSYLSFSYSQYDGLIYTASEVTLNDPLIFYCAVLGRYSGKRQAGA